MEDIKCGIVGFGTAFPETVRTYEDIAELSGIPAEVIRDKFGINQIYYPGNNEQTSDLAVAAAQDCLKNTGVDPKEIDLIIYFGENYGDHVIYSIGPKVQRAIGAENAWCYQMECKCGSGIVAMDQAKKYMQTEDDINTVMLVGGYRNVDKVDYTDKGVSFLFDVSCGGAACILKKGYERRNFLSAAAILDGSFSESIVVPGGGTKIPFTPENIHDPYLDAFRLEEPDIFRDQLGKVTFSNLVAAEEKALAKLGYTLADLDFVCDIHMNKRGHRTIFEMMNMPLEKGTYLSDYGHVGQLDILIALKMADEQNLVKEGDLVGVIGMGFGYIWNGGVIRW